MRPVVNLINFFSRHPLTRDAKLRAWLRFLSWQIQCRIEDEVIFEWIAGQKLAVRRGMTGATGNIYAGLHEFSDMALLIHFLREDDLFFDVGANIGSYSVLASGVCRATTWAFEPDPRTSLSLKRNVEVNKLDDLVTVHQIAIGDVEGQLEFTEGLDTVNRAAIEEDVVTQTVPVGTLDSIAGMYCPLMLKIDVEGYEPHVLRGAATHIKNENLKVIVVETTTPEIESEFGKHGFVRGYYDPFKRKLSKSSNEYLDNNKLFIRDWHFVAQRLQQARHFDVLGHSI